MNLIKNHFIFSITALLFFSCVSTKKISVDEKTFDELLEIYKSNFQKIFSYSGNGTIELNLKNIKTILQFSIQTKKPSKALLDLYGPFGFDIGSVYLNNDSIIIYNAFQEQIILTEFSSEKFKDLTSTQLDKDFIFSMLFGYFDLQELEEDSSIIKNKENEFELIKFLKGRKLMLVYEKVSSSLNKITVFENFNEPIFEIAFAEIKNYNELKFPYKISFVNFKTNESISLKFKKIEFNKFDDEINFEIPEGVEIIRW